MTRVQVGAVDMGLRTMLIAVLAVELIVVCVVALVGGASPVLWAVLIFLGVGIVVAARVRAHPSRTVLLAGPVVLGGAAAIALGASDYLPWLTSPALWLGIVGSTLAGAWLVRTGRARPRDVVEGLVVGVVLFGLGWVALLAAILFYVFVWPGPS